MCGYFLLPFFFVVTFFFTVLCLYKVYAFLFLSVVIVVLSLVLSVRYDSLILVYIH